LRRIVSKDHTTTAAQVIAELNVHLETPYVHKLSDVSFTNPTFTVGLQLLNLWLLKVMLRYLNDGVDYETWTSDDWKRHVMWPDESPFTLLPTSGRVYVSRATKEAYNPECLVPTVKHVGGSVKIWAAVLWYSILLVPLLHFMTELLRGCTWTVLDNQVNPMMQTLLPNNDAVFQGDSAPIHTAGSVQSWFEEHEDELQHLPWPTQSVDLNNIEPLWLVLEIRLRNRFPLPTSLKQLEDVLQEEWYKIPVETVLLQEELGLYLRHKVAQCYINKEIVQHL
jgi:hypothetical protein